MKPRKGIPIRKRREKLHLNCNLYNERLDCNLTLKALSDQVGLDVSLLHRAESGGHINLTSALRLARFYGKTVDEIWRLA